MVAVVEGNVDSQLGSGKQQSFLLGVLANRVDESVGRNAVHNRLPAFAIVARAIDIRRLIVEPVTINRNVSHGGIEARGLDHRDLAPVAESRRRHVLPVLAAVARQMQQPGIAARQISSPFSGEGAILNTTP